MSAFLFPLPLRALAAKQTKAGGGVASGTDFAAIPTTPAIPATSVIPTSPLIPTTSVIPAQAGIHVFLFLHC